MTLRIVLMGVAGCGKSSVGARLAERLGATYFDGDDLHSTENIEKMRRGSALTDADRWPWLERVAAKLAEGQGIQIVGCSALKRRYRDHIIASVGAPVMFVHLSGTKDLILSRMVSREGHFMPASLVDSQFDALEAPAADENAITVDIARPIEHIVEDLAAHLRELTS